MPNDRSVRLGTGSNGEPGGLGQCGLWTRAVGLSFCFCFKEGMLGAQSKEGGFHDGQTMGDLGVAATQRGALRKARSLPLRAPRMAVTWKLRRGMEQAERMLHPRILVMERRAPVAIRSERRAEKIFPPLAAQWTRIARRGSFA